MNIYKTIVTGLIVFIALFVYLITVQMTEAPAQESLGAFRTSGAKDIGTFRTYQSITATSSSATSTEVSIAGAKKVTLFMNRPTSAANATSTFAVQVTLDGTNYIAYNKLIDNVSNTNAQELTRVSSKQLVGTTSAMVSVDLTSDSIIGLKCIAVIAGTGTHTCSVLVEN